MNYDYLIVGAGLYGAVFAHEMKKAGKKCLVIDNKGDVRDKCAYVWRTHFPYQ